MSTCLGFGSYLLLCFVLHSRPSIWPCVVQWVWPLIRDLACSITVEFIDLCLCFPWHLRLEFDVCLLWRAMDFAVQFILCEEECPITCNASHAWLCVSDIVVGILRALTMVEPSPSTSSARKVRFFLWLCFPSFFAILPAPLSPRVLTWVLPLVYMLLSFRYCASSFWLPTGFRLGSVTTYRAFGYPSAVLVSLFDPGF